MSSRLESLDWLRGLMALSIMLYHFGGQHDAASPLGRLGVYGVSIFFILSGLSMAVAYDGHTEGIRGSVRFFVRRIFRIWPLLWMAIALVAIPAYVLGKGLQGQAPYDLATIFLNLTTLFGFVAPTQYINMGAWSIGNEMVYYALTPIFIAAYRWRRYAGNLLVLATFGVGLFFAFHVLTPERRLDTQWASYVNPLNNICLYCAGLAIYYNFSNVKMPRGFREAFWVMVVVAFFIYPVSGDQINLVTGFNRVAMVALSIGVVLAFYKCAPVLPEFISRGLEKLGVATYGVYLLHPIVMDFTRLAFRAFGLQIKYVPLLVAVVGTIVLALLIYKYFELPFINLGKKLTKSRKSTASVLQDINFNKRA